MYILRRSFLRFANYYLPTIVDNSQETALWDMTVRRLQAGMAPILKFLICRLRGSNMNTGTISCRGLLKSAAWTSYFSLLRKIIRTTRIRPHIHFHYLAACKATYCLDAWLQGCLYNSLQNSETILRHPDHVVT